MAGTGKFLKVLFLVAVVVSVLAFGLSPYKVVGQYQFYCGLCPHRTTIINWGYSSFRLWFIIPECPEVISSQNNSFEGHLVKGSCQVNLNP